MDSIVTGFKNIVGCATVPIHPGARDFLEYKASNAKARTIPGKLGEVGHPKTCLLAAALERAPPPLIPARDNIGPFLPSHLTEGLYCDETREQGFGYLGEMCQSGKKMMLDCIVSMKAMIRCYEIKNSLKKEEWLTMSNAVRNSSNISSSDFD